MSKLIDAANAILRSVPAGDGWAETALEGLRIRRIVDRTPFDSHYPGPLCGLVIQGRKVVTTGGRQFVITAGDAMIISHHIPAFSRVVEGSRTRPYLGAVLPFNMALLAELWREVGNPMADMAARPAIETMRATPEIEDAFLRLLLLDAAPVEAPVLAPLIVKEIHLRFLLCAQGAMLRNLITRDGQASRIGRVIAYLRQTENQACPVAHLAEIAGMSTSSFFSHFKAVTGLTPLGFQKELRLMRARHLLVDPAQSVSSVAFAVGYESPTHFSREYARRFGASPRRHRSSGGHLIA